MKRTIHAEYYPTGDQIFIVPLTVVGSYYMWFEAKKDAIRSCPKEDRICRAYSTEITKATPYWVCFDLANGHEATRRYCWVFSSRDAAMAHRKEQHKKEGAKLAMPQRWYFIV